MRFWDLFQWWNLIFTLPFGIGLLPLLLQAVGAVRLSHGHLPTGGSHSPHAGHAPAHGVHGRAPQLRPSHGSPHKASTETRAPSQSQSPHTLSRLLSLLGIGKVPIMLVFSIFCLIWGVTGVLGNELFPLVLHLPALYVWPSIFCAFVVSYFSTGAMAQGISRIMPELETYGTNEASLVGRSARAACDLGAKPGSAFLLDDQQNRVQVRCRTHDGSTIPRGAEVLLLEYDRQSRIFTVALMQREATLSNQSQPSQQPAPRQEKMKLH